MAITSADFGRSQLPRSICRYNQRACKNANEERRGSDPISPPGGLIAGEDTHEEILRAILHKTDSAGSLKILLPGSWNQVEAAWKRVRKSRLSRISFGEFQSELAGRIWPLARHPQIGQVFVNK